MLFIFQLSFLASSVNLFVEQKELRISLLAEMSHLQQQCLPGTFWPDLPKGLGFADDILKVPTLSFQLPKGYFKWNKKKRILKFNLTICRESEKSHGEWESYPFQFSGLDNSMDCKNHWNAKSLTRLIAYKLPSLSEKKIYFSIISVIDIDCGHPKNGKKWRKEKTKCCQLGEGGMGNAWHEWGVLDMNLLGSGGIEWEGANVDIGDGYTALWRP